VSSEASLPSKCPLTKWNLPSRKLTTIVWTDASLLRIVSQRTGHEPLRRHQAVPRRRLLLGAVEPSGVRPCRSPVPSATAKGDGDNRATQSCAEERQRALEHERADDRLPETEQARAARDRGEDRRYARGALFSDFNEQDGRFTDFYWTHFIKCPGQLRQKRKFGGRGRLREGACADRWLLAEIKALKPTIILSFGAQASTWILSKARYGGKWTDWVWDEFRRIITNQEAPTADVDGFGTTLIAALHPSGANPLALSFNEKIGQLVKASLARPPRT
jgi:hypothetical protein